MRLLITGGCGFLGSNLAADALAHGDTLCVLDNMSRRGGPENLAWLRQLGEFEFVRADTRSPREVEELIARFRPEVVFHLAGQVAMTTSIADPRLDFETNVLGTFNVLEAVRTHVPHAAVIYSSTNKVYGDLEQYTYEEAATRYRCVECPEGFDETTALDFRSPYGCSKGAADQYVLDYARVFGLDTVVFRHSSMYGGRQHATFDQGWIGWFCEQALRIRSAALERPLTIAGNGKQVRDVLHAEDMKRLYRAAVGNIARARGHAFNIGGGAQNSLSLLELFALLEEMLGIRMAYEALPPRSSDQRVFVADIGKAERILGWRPRVGYREGIEDMLRWLTSAAAVPSSAAAPATTGTRRTPS